jgi:hypothetical protein
MIKFLWIPFFLGFIAGPVKAQAILSNKNDQMPFMIAENANQDSSTLSSSSNAEMCAENQIPSNSGTIPLTVEGKLGYVLASFYDVTSIISSAAGAGIKQMRDSVPEWGQGMEGYGKRFASSYGRKAIRRSIQVGIGILMHEDPRYFPSKSSGIWQRSLYAVSRTFVSNKDGGGIRPGYSKFIGTFSGTYISRQWYPEKYRTPSEYFSSFAISIGVDVGKNAFNEFWPDVKRLIRR